MSLHFEDRELQIELTGLEIRMQRKTAEISTYTSIILSLMVVTAFTLYTWAITEKNINYVFMGMVGAIFYGLLFVIINRYYSSELDRLEGQIQDLKKKYIW